jgi:hypothetical protein
MGVDAVGVHDMLPDICRLGPVALGIIKIGQNDPRVVVHPGIVQISQAVVLSHALFEEITHLPQDVRLRSRIHPGKAIA